MYHKPYAKIAGGQDGAIFADTLFRFGPRGKCRVYDLSAALGDGEELTPISEFMLDRAEEIAPHSNAVAFGREYYAEGDEFPLLYTNIYNNYKNAEDKLIGVLCVYRIVREGDGFASKLVQLIEVGFTEDREIWRSGGDIEDVRPYGNFAVDTEGGRLIAFVMRDGAEKTRYFTFDLPKLSDGEICPRFGVRRALLRKEDIISSFDVPYHRYIQGACYRGGRVYSLEGFGSGIHPAIRVIDVDRGEQLLFVDLYAEGLTEEAEFVEFYGERCLYSDVAGNVFELSELV